MPGLSLRDAAQQAGTSRHTPRGSRQDGFRRRVRTMAATASTPPSYSGSTRPRSAPMRRNGPRTNRQDRTHRHLQRPTQRNSGSSTSNWKPSSRLTGTFWRRRGNEVKSYARNAAGGPRRPSAWPCPDQRQHQLGDGGPSPGRRVSTKIELDRHLAGRMPGSAAGEHLRGEPADFTVRPDPDLARGAGRCRALALALSPQPLQPSIGPLDTAHGVRSGSMLFHRGPGSAGQTDRQSSTNATGLALVILNPVHMADDQVTEREKGRKGIRVLDYIAEWPSSEVTARPPYCATNEEYLRWRELRRKQHGVCKGAGTFSLRGAVRGRLAQRRNARQQRDGRGNSPALVQLVRCAQHTLWFNPRSADHG